MRGVKQPWCVHAAANWHPGLRDGVSTLTVSMARAVGTKAYPMAPRIRFGRYQMMTHMLSTYWNRAPRTSRKYIIRTGGLGGTGGWQYLHLPPLPQTIDLMFQNEASALSDFGRTQRSRFVGFYTRLNCRRLLSADAFMINSVWGLRMMRQAGYAHKTHLVYPACEMSPTHKVKPTRDRGIDVVTIGTISPKKRHHDTLAACAASRLCSNVAIVGRRDAPWYETEISRISETMEGAVMYCDASESEKWQIM